MAVRKILKLGDPLLRKKSEPISEDEVLSKDFKKLVRDMFDTMKHAEGVGLAAPQIGILKQLVVVGNNSSERYQDASVVKDEILINPVITPLTDKIGGYWEGCLSVPGMRGFVERPLKIRLEYRDLKFELYDIEVEGFQAIVYQHECDHLNGLLYVDRLKDTRLFGFTDTLEGEESSLD